MEFIKHLLKTKKIHTLEYNYMLKKLPLIKEKNMEVEDLLYFHRIISEEVICEEVKEFSEGKVNYDCIGHFVIDDQLRSIYRQFPEGSEIIPVSLQGSKLVVASFKNDRVSLHKRIELLFKDLDVTLLYPLKAAYIEKKCDLESKFEDYENEANFSPSSKLDLILIDAVKAGATDIHIQAIFNTKLRRPEYPVSFRVARRIVPWTRFKLTAEENKGIVFAVTHRGEAGNSADLGTPEGVSTTITDLVGGHTHLGRVQASECLLGYRSVIRIHDINKAAISYEELGLSPKALARIKSLAQKESGFTLVTGHPGSGKNTTVNAMNKDIIENKEVILVEYSSPVEVLQSCTQYDYGDDTNMLKARIKASKKEDLDMAFCGEIPDNEVGILLRDLFYSDIAVIATTHLNRVWHCIQKLYSVYGERDYLDVLTQTNGIINQKMFQKICPSCKIKQEVSDLSFEDMKIAVALKLNQPIFRVNEEGCSDCKLGFVEGGLRPYAEILEFDLKLVDKCLSINNPSRIEMFLQEHIINNRESMEYFLREDLYKGIVDLAQVRRKGVTCEILK